MKIFVFVSPSCRPKASASKPTSPRLKRASAGLTTDELASFLGVDGVRVSRERYQSTAAAKADIAGGLVLLFHGLDGAIVDDPSSAKRFWSAAERGGKFRVYEHEVSAKHLDLTVEHYSNTVVTSTAGLRKITVLIRSRQHRCENWASRGRRGRLGARFPNGGAQTKVEG